MKLDTSTVFRLQSLINEKIRNQSVSLDKISKETGVDRTQIWRFQKGHFKTFSNNLATICKYLSINRQDFMEGRDQVSILLETLHEVWDGSEEHAYKITNLLRNTAPLLES